MAKFCTKCGAPLIEGVPHVCPAEQGEQGTPTEGQTGGQTGGSFGGQTGGNFGGQTGGNFGGQNQGGQQQGGGFDPWGSTPGQNQTGFDGQTGGGFGGQTGGGFGGHTPASEIGRSKALQLRIGVVDPGRSSDGVYERGTQIVPDNLPLNEGEVPIRQYNVAVLRSRLKLERAEGRLQVTNKRLLFRATGRSVRGKTTLQHEFALDDIKGFEIRKDYRFSFLDLVAAVICVIAVGAAFGALVTAIAGNSAAFGCVLGVLLGAASVVPFFMLCRRFFLKVLCSAAGTLPAISAFTVARLYVHYRGGFGWSLLVGLSTIVVIASVIILIASIFLFCIKPNLVFDFKTMGGGAPIQIRSRSSAFSLNRNDYTGFSEVLPAADTEKALREIGALINDVQKLGDRAIDQWKDR